MADTVLARRRSSFERIGRWAGGVALVGSIAFIGERLWRLDWSTLQPHASWGLAGAMVGAPLLFAVADRALARAWTAVVDPEHTQPPRNMARIYARGVLMKYLPGSIFQYVSRQVEGAKTGIEHKLLAKSVIVEVGLHLVSSMSVAAACLTFERAPVVAIVAAAIVVGASLAARRPLLTALAFQILAFGAFALAAALIGAAVLPAGASLAHFAALFLLAWLAGFVVPVAPGGIGIREAALLALAGAGLPAAGLMAATLALRASSIAGDLGYGLITLGRRRN
ncbi:hypothetical protein [Sphingopyxis sp.]|uniref:hypothetical protein n=1 Tax=Sphingopyxis sp. TaxID=1908224 RepID=UPI003D6CBE5D